MTLVTDLDLLRLEPRLFIDAADSGLILLARNDAVASGGTVTSASSDFIDLGLGVTYVVVIDGEPVEVLAVTSATTLDVSRRRLDDESPVLPPADGTGLALTVITFASLLMLHESWALGALGVDPADPVQPVEVAQVLNLDDFRRLIALRTIGQALSRSSALNPASVSLAALAAHYEAPIAEASRRAAARIDLDGDGRADLVRRLDASALLRT